MKVRFSPQAAEQAQDAAAWWRRNRRLSPRLFRQELAQALQILRTAPHAGPTYQHPRLSDVRRIILLQTRYHLYYTVDEVEGVVILAVWSTLRGHEPDL